MSAKTYTIQALVCDWCDDELEGHAGLSLTALKVEARKEGWYVGTNNHTVCEDCLTSY